MKYDATVSSCVYITGDDPKSLAQHWWDITVNEDGLQISSAYCEGGVEGVISVPLAEVSAFLQHIRLTLARNKYITTTFTVDNDVDIEIEVIEDGISIRCSGGQLYVPGDCMGHFVAGIERAYRDATGENARQASQLPGLASAFNSLQQRAQQLEAAVQEAKASKQ